MFNIYEDYDIPAHLMWDNDYDLEFYFNGNVETSKKVKVPATIAEIKESIEQLHKFLMEKFGLKQLEPARTAKRNALWILKMLEHTRSNVRAHRNPILAHTSSAAKSTDTGDSDQGDPPGPSHSLIPCITYQSNNPFRVVTCLDRWSVERGRTV